MIIFPFFSFLFSSLSFWSIPLTDEEIKGRWWFNRSHPYFSSYFRVVWFCGTFFIIIIFLFLFLLRIFTIIMTSSGWEGQWHGYKAARRRTSHRNLERKRFNWVASRHVFIHARIIFIFIYIYTWIWNVLRGYRARWILLSLTDCFSSYFSSFSFLLPSLLNTLEMDETRRHAYSTPREN